MGQDGEAVLFEVFRRLDPESLAIAACVSRSWRSIATSNGLWKGHCARLWEGKIHVLSGARELLDSGEGHKAYRDSLLDSRRQHLTDEELASIVWHYRMKKSAGGSWIEEDPYWNGKPANRRKFHADGSVSRITDSGLEEPVDRVWRWVSGSGGRVGPRGSFLRFSSQGREFPTHFVSRHPANWGWILQNCWSVTMSFPPPPPGEDPALDDEGLAIGFEDQYDEAVCFNIGLPTLPEGSDGGEALRALLRSLQDADGNVVLQVVGEPSEGDGGSEDGGSSEDDGDGGEAAVAEPPESEMDDIDD